MNDLIESLEKSINFMKARYPADHNLLKSLEDQLHSLKEKKQRASERLFSTDEAAAEKTE